MIFLLIKNNFKEIKEIIIDEEYQGKSPLIKNFLFQEIKRANSFFSKQDIAFHCIGKKSRAHFIAYGVAIGKRKADMEVGAREILRIVAK